MRVILRENIENLGKKGDIVNIAPGYGRNYLIPKKIAIEVTSRNMNMIKIEQKALQKGLEKEMASYQELIDRLNAVTLSFTRKASEKDVIFGSVSSTDIRDALTAQGFEVEKKKILLEEPIKRLGNYTVPIKIFHEERAEIKLEVVTEGEPSIKEEKVEEVAAQAEEKIQDVPLEIKEDLKPEPDIAEEKQVLEEAKDIPGEAEKLEPIVETEIIESEKETMEEPSLEETKEAPLDIPEESLDKQETESGEKPEESGVIPEEPEESPEDIPEMSTETNKSSEDLAEIPEETKENSENAGVVSKEPEGSAEEEANQEAASKDNK